MSISKKKFLFFTSAIVYLAFIYLDLDIGPLSAVIYSIYCVSVICFCLFISENALAPSSIFIYFYMVFLGTGVLILLQRNYLFDMNALFYISEGILAFIIGTVVSSSRRVRVPKIIPQNINYKVMMKYSKIICSVGIASGLYYLLRNFRYMIVNFEDNRVSAQSGNGFLLYFMCLVIPCGIMMFECYLNGVKDRSIWLYIGLGAVIMVLAGSRSRLIELILGLVLVYNQRKRMKPETVIKLGIVCLLIVSVLGAFRNGISGTSSSILGKLIGTIYVNDINLSYVFGAFPDKVPFQHGSTYLMNFMLLLPGSQPDFTLWLKSAIGLTFAGGGVTPSIVGESYLNFGNYGIIGVLFILGVVFNRMDVSMRNAKNHLPHIVLTLYLCKSVTSGLANVFLRLIFFESVVLLVSFLSRKRKMRTYGF